jgi:IclR family transcriptional regulator, acetate operon repressor
VRACRQLLALHFHATRHASTGAIGAQIFNIDGLVVRGRHANLNGRVSLTDERMMSEGRLIQSIERAAAILEIIAQEGGAARLQHIAEQAKLGKTTAHNLLKTLDELGYVHRRAGDSRYYLGGRILNLARIAGDDGALRSRLRPALEAVARRTGAMVYLAVPSGDKVCYLDAIEPSHALRMGACPIGVRKPVEGSAVGLVFLAFMPRLGKRVLASRADALGPQILSEIRTVATRGFALDLENSKPGLHCVAIPWREGGEVRASVGLSVPSARLSPQALTDMAWMMMKEVERA